MACCQSLWTTMAFVIRKITGIVRGFFQLSRESLQANGLSWTFSSSWHSLFLNPWASGGPHSTCRKWRRTESAQFSSRWNRCPWTFCLRIPWVSIARTSSLSWPPPWPLHQNAHCSYHSRINDDPEQFVSSYEEVEPLNGRATVCLLWETYQCRAFTMKLMKLRVKR